MTDKEYIEIPCDVLLLTELAVMIDDGDKKVWIPKSQMDPDEVPDGPATGTSIFIGEWIAQEKGLI